MWMQNSMEGASIHSRNANNFQNPYDRRTYGGGSSHSGASSSSAGDWKSKLIESGQWLGGKVIEYGGKIARGSSHDSIPDAHHGHFGGAGNSQQRNDGRASWMADIRNSSSSFSNHQPNEYHGPSGTYQNDFVTERPPAYSDSRPTSSARYSPRHQHPSQEKPSMRRVKKKSHSSKKSKKKASRKHRYESTEESESPSEEEEEESSESEPESDHKPTKHAKKSKKQSKKQLKSRALSSEDSEDDESEDSDADRKKKTASRKKLSDPNYQYSFDPSRLPPPPPSSDKTSKSKSKKSRRRKQSIESSGSDAPSDKENNNQAQKTSKKRSNSKTKAVKDADVDLLGVDFAATSLAPPTNQAPQQPTPSVFDTMYQPHSTDPMQDLAGLHFDPAYASMPAPQCPTIFAQQQQQQPPQQSPQENATAVGQKLLPENDIVDLETLASDKKKTKDTRDAVADKKTLNDLQKETSEPPTPVMPVHHPHAANASMMMPMNMNAMQMQQMQYNNPHVMMQMQYQMQYQMQQQQQQPPQSGFSSY